VQTLGEQPPAQASWVIPPQAQPFKYGKEGGKQEWLLYTLATQVQGNLGPDAAKEIWDVDADSGER